MIISANSLKGGSGKTTIATHLAHAIALAKGKPRVLLVDADPQGSAQEWAEAREEKPPFQIIGMARNTLHRDLPDLIENYDHAVIDTPPRVSALARSAILASDLVLIPVQPSSYDVWAASETVALVEDARGFKPELKAAFVINRRITNTAIGDDVKDALADYDIPLLSSVIGQRVIFSEASAGYSVFELDRKSTAATEIKTLAKNILKFMGAKKW